jgi:hypothetical protein
MMGPSHALSGAAGSWALDHYARYTQSPLAVAVGTAVCAGGALLPDLDLSGKVTRNRGGATIARTFGVFSLFAAEVTCGCPATAGIRCSVSRSVWGASSTCSAT